MELQNEIIYCLVLGFSILAGFYVRTITTPAAKQLVTACFGFFTVLALCGGEVVHSVIAVLSTLLIVKSRSRQTPLMAFIVIFSLLLIYRGSTWFGLRQPSALGNALQLIMSLKLIGVAIEIHDFRQEKQKKEEKEEAGSRFQLSLDEEPTAFEIICYSYCYVGLFTGPFFKYRTYYDFLRQTPKCMETIPWKEELEKRLKQVALFGLLYLLSSYFFSIKYVKSDEFYEHGFFYRLIYMVPIFFIGRMRFYSAWLLSECAYVTSALGAYPEETKPRPGHGPTIDMKSLDPSVQDSQEIEYSFETIRNINPSGSDWSKTVRDGMRNWNMSVQWWLANYVHKRWPGHLKQFRTAAVLVVSAYWHGLWAGYFGAFLTMPFIMLAEDLMMKTVKQKLPENLHSSYDWVNWFFKMRSFEYMYMAFALLTWKDTYRWWSSVYFIGHICCLLVIVVCMLLQNLSSSSTKSAKKTE